MTSAIDYRLLAKQFSDLLTIRKTLRIPKLNPNNTLGDAVHQLTEAVNISYEEGITPANAIERVFIEVERVAQEPHVQEFVFEPIEKMATTFSERINSSFTALSRYHKIVETINDDTTIRISKIIDANPFLREALQQPADPAQNYPKLSWNEAYNIPGYSESEVVNRVHQRTGRTDSMPTISAAQTLLNDVNLQIVQNYDTVAIPAETMTALISRLSSAVPTVAVDDIKLFVNRIISKSAMSQHRSVITNGFSAAEGISVSDTALQVIEMTQKLSALLPELDNASVWDLSPASTESVMKNLVIFKKYIDLCLYLLTFHRRDTYKDTILLPNSYLNLDNYDTFFGHEGATPVMLRDYVTVVFANDTFKSTIRGVQVDEVFERAPQVAKRIEQGKQSVATKLEFTLNGVRRSALIQAMLAFAETKPADLEQDPDVDIKRLAEAKAQKVVASGVDLRSGIYEFIFQAYRVNPFSVILYENIGLQYTRVLATTHQLDELTLCSMEVNVVARLIQLFTQKLCCA